MAQWIKNPPAMQETQETQVWSLGREYPLKKEMCGLWFPQPITKVTSEITDHRSPQQI